MHVTTRDCGVLVATMTPVHFSSKNSPKQKRGRPRTKSEVDSLRVRLWYLHVANNYPARSAYKLEKAFAYIAIRNVSNRRSSTELSGKWKQYRKGNMVPHPILVEEVEKACPGSKYFLEHPIWDIIRAPQFPTTDYSLFLVKLSDEIVNCLFKEITLDGSLRLERRNFSIKTIETLQKHFNLDSLAACLAIAKESAQNEYHLPYMEAVHVSLNIILILSTFPPLYYIAAELFECIRKHCFYFITPLYRNVNLEEINFADYQFEQTAIILMMEDFGFLKCSLRHQLACLLSARKHGLTTVYNMLSRHFHDKSWDNVQSDPILIKIRNDIPRVLTMLNKSTCPWP